MDPIQALSRVYELVSSNFVLYWALHVNDFRDGAVFTLVYSLILVPMAAIFIHGIYHDDLKYKKYKWTKVFDVILQTTALGGIFVVIPLLLVLLLATPGTQQALNLLDANANIKYDVQLKSAELIEKLPDSVPFVDKYIYSQADALRYGLICGALILLVIIVYASFIAHCWQDDDDISEGERSRLLFKLAVMTILFYIGMLTCLTGVLFFPSTKTLILLHLYGT